MAGEVKQATDKLKATLERGIKNIRESGLPINENIGFSELVDTTTNIGTKTIKSNGAYDSLTDGLYAFREVIVDVPTTTEIVECNHTFDQKHITTNNTTYYAKDDNLDGWNEVTVEVPEYKLEDSDTITENGTYNA
jgi:hypothetical protein